MRVDSVRTLEQFRVDEGVSLKLLKVRVASKTKQAEVLSRVGSQKPQQMALCPILRGLTSKVGAIALSNLGWESRGAGAVPRATAHAGERGRRASGAVAVCSRLG